MSRKQKKAKARARCDRRREYHDRVEAMLVVVRAENAARMAEYNLKNAVCAAFFNEYHGQEIDFPVTVHNCPGGTTWTVIFTRPSWWNGELVGGGYRICAPWPLTIKVAPCELGYNGGWLDKPTPLDPPYQVDLKLAERKFRYQVEKEMGSQFI